MPSFSLLPSQPKFFELFEKSSAALYEIARALEDLVTHYEDVPAKCARITELEQQGDAIVAGHHMHMGMHGDLSSNSPAVPPHVVAIRLVALINPRLDLFE